MKFSEMIQNTIALAHPEIHKTDYLLFRLRRIG
jgi:hypothetical protein